MAHHVVLATESRAAKLAIESWRNANAFIAHMALQMALAEITLVADGAVETLLVLILIRIIAAKNAVLVVVLQVWWVRTKSNPGDRWLVVWCVVM